MSILPTSLHSDGAAAAERRVRLRSKGRLHWDTTGPKKGPKRLALKNHLIAMIGEYVGTVLFMIFALGGANVALTPAVSLTGEIVSGQHDSLVSTVNTSNLLHISLCFGFSLAVNAWIFFRVSGGLFHPAVSLSMVLVGALAPARGALLIVVQILGGVTGAAMIDAVISGTLTQLGGGTSVIQGLFIEMSLTALLMIAILLLAAEKNRATFIAPIGIGLALFVAELLGVYYTGGSLNPARSFGPSVVLNDFSSYHWIYWFGPALGAVLAAGFYKLLKWLQYETCLGPEGAAAPSTSLATGTKVNAGAMGGMVDEEKAVEGEGMAISGPGLGDLHMEDVPQTTGTGVSSNIPIHAEFEDQLNRIEAMLLRLTPHDSEPHRSPYPHAYSLSRSSPAQGSMATVVVQEEAK